MIDIYTKYQNMSFAELRSYYASVKRRQKFLYSLPIVSAFFGFFISYFVMSGRIMAEGMKAAPGGIWGMAGFVIFGICVPLLPIMHTKRKFGAPLVMMIYTLSTLLFSDDFSPLSLVMTLYLFLAVVLMCPLTEQLNFMRSLPDYPFPERVEAARIDYEHSMRFSETSEETKAIMNQNAESYDGSQVEQLLSTLPKRHYDGPGFSQDGFDEIDLSYTDSLVGETEKKKKRRREFDEPLEVFSDIKTSTGINTDRRDRIDELDGKFKGDYIAAPRLEAEDVSVDEI